MITRKFTINVSNNSASSTQKIVLYKGDSGLLLNLELKNFKFDVNSRTRIDATITKSNNSTELVGSKRLTLNGDTAVLIIGRDGFEFTTTGMYHVQLHIFDENSGRISAPSFDIEVRDTIY